MRNPLQLLCKLRVKSLFLQMFLLYGVSIAQAEFLNRAAIGWAVSCSAFGLFLFFIFRSFVGEQTQTPTRPILITG